MDRINIIENKYKFDIEKFLDIEVDKKSNKVFVLNKLLGNDTEMDIDKFVLLSYLVANEFAENPYLFETRDKIIELLEGKEMIQSKKKMFSNYLKEYELRVKRNTLFIGLNEREIGLTNAVFNLMNKNAYYTYITNEKLLDQVSLFGEEFLCYAKYKNKMKDINKINFILENYTSRVIELIKIIKEQYDVKNYEVFLIANDMSKEDEEYIQKVCKDNNLDIKIKYFIKLEYDIELVNNEIEEDIEVTKYDTENDIEDVDVLVKEHKLDILHIHKYDLDNQIPEKQTFISQTGRFGTENESNKCCVTEILRKAKSIDLDILDNSVIMGFGEFSLIPLLIGRLFAKDISYLNVTKKEIDLNFEETMFNEVDKIRCPYGLNEYYYIYDLSKYKDKDITLILEREPIEDFINELKIIMNRRGVNNINILHF